MTIENTNNDQCLDINIQIKRHEKVSSLINCKNWEDLNEMLSSYEPHVVILISRRMPRFYQLMKDILTFGDAEVFSDFAIPYIYPNLEGKRIAIVDDSVNVGTTLESVCRRLIAARPSVAKCFTVFKKNPELSRLAGIELEHVELVHDDNNSYSKSSLNLVRSLFYQNRPFEIEFPVLKLEFEDGIAPSDIFTRLIGNNSWEVKDVTPFESRGYGLYRFSIDTKAESTQNCKFRLYLDEYEKFIYFVPIVSHEKYLAFNVTHHKLPDYIKNLFLKTEQIDEKYESFFSETLFRLRMFIASMIFGFPLIRELESILSPTRCYIEKEDITLLFGAEVSDLLTRFYSEYSDSMEICKLIHDLEEQADTPFYESLKKSPEIFSMLTEQDSESGQRTMPDSYGRKLVDFFNRLGKLTDESDQACLPDLPDYRPSKQDLEANKYLRLRIGPTFSELMEIMRKYWHQSPATKKISTLHTLLSRLLDHHIDQGYIVPVLNLYGQRVFRKGEAAPFDMNEIAIFDSWGIQVHPGDDIKIILKEKCSSIQRATFYQVMYNMDASYLDM